MNLTHARTPHSRYTERDRLILESSELFTPASPDDLLFLFCTVLTELNATAHRFAARRPRSITQIDAARTY